MVRSTVNPKVPSPLRILIDGQSGAGKTTLADHLGKKLGALVLSSDDWVHGWTSYPDAAKTTLELLTGVAEHYTRFDWVRQEAAEKVRPDPTLPWIIEGSGTLTPETRKQVDLAIWVQTEPRVAKKRGLTRDGASYAPWWEVWSRQELRHIQTHDPKGLADIIFST